MHTNFAKTAGHREYPTKRAYEESVVMKVSDNDVDRTTVENEEFASPKGRVKRESTVQALRL